MSPGLKKIVSVVLRYRLIHVVFWLLKAVTLYHQLSLLPGRTPFWNWFDTVNITVFEMLAVYTTTYYLFPKIYLKERYSSFWLGVLVVVIVVPVLGSTVQILMMKMHSAWHFNLAVVLVTYLGECIDVLVVTLVFVIIVLIEFYYNKDQNNRQLEKARLEAELNYLKAQINPHFLFNALNSIYVLMSEDVKKSEETLLKFSALLRYQLYDCGRITTLENEIGFLENYISLEQLRSGKNRKLHVSLPGQADNLEIAPFIISPFVENAFKHVSHYSNKPNEIRIGLRTENNYLFLAIENTFEKPLPGKPASIGGIGLQNVKRRLELEYPSRHWLQIDKQEQVYKVSLKLELKGNEVY